jgi:hypothetical protein
VKVLRERRDLRAPVIDRGEGSAGRVKGAAKILISAPLAKIQVLLAILVCKTLAQKFILLRGLLPQPAATLFNIAGRSSGRSSCW